MSEHQNCDIQIKMNENPMRENQISAEITRQGVRTV